MTSLELQRAYLAGGPTGKVAYLARLQGVSRNAVYKRLHALGTELRPQGPVRRGSLADEIHADLIELAAPQTCEQMQAWIGESQMRVIGGLLALIRQGRVAFIPVIDAQAQQLQRVEQGQLL